jgi:hypothetical protein
MTGHRFEYGPLARGTFIALVCMSPVVAIVSWEWLGWHLVLLIFLALGLRPLLEKTGIHALYQHVMATIEERLYRGFTEQRRKEVERAARRKRYKRVGPEDPRLPKNW